MKCFALNALLLLASLAIMAIALADISRGLFETTPSEHKRRLANATGKLERMLTLLLKDRISEDVAVARIRVLEVEKKSLAAELALAPNPDVVTLHPPRKPSAA